MRFSRNSSSKKSHCRTFRTLPERMNICLYRMILYADDFQSRSALFHKGSVGILYRAPSSFRVLSRKSQTFICTLSLTLTAVPTNTIVGHLTVNLIGGSIDEFECFDDLGERVKVFFNIHGIIEKYSAFTAVVDMNSHTATVPYTHCGLTSCD